MKPNLGLTVASLSPFLILGLACSNNQYPFQETCCDYCPPGEQLVNRCTKTSKTACELCEENYYNDAYTYSRCKPCMACDHARGLQEVRPCQKTSNTVCACLPGHSLENRGVSEDKKRCKPCPAGYFSRGGSESCHPWTNCTARGSKTLRPGKADADSICNDPSSEPLKVSTVTLPTSLTRGHGRGKMSTVPSSSRTNLANPQGFEWGPVITILLLSVAGGTGLVFVYWRVKKKKAQIQFEVVWVDPNQDKGHSYRVPVQEEQIQNKSDFV